MHNYKVAVTSSLMWVQEARLSAQYIIDGYSRNELGALAREENIYNASSDDSKSFSNVIDEEIGRIKAKNNL